jgi:predicted transcriptional regulator with HTH domain
MGQITGDMERIALRKIYEAALTMVDETHDLKEINIYLRDDPSTEKLGIQLEDAYETAQALARIGLLRIENHEPIAVKLTENGIRKAEQI